MIVWTTRVSPSDMAVYSRRAENVVQRRFCYRQSFCRSATAVVQRTSDRDDSVICGRSVVALRPSCRNVAQRRFCSLRSFCRSPTAVVQGWSHREDSVVYLRSSIRLRSSCRERRVELILRSAVVLPYC